MVLLKDLKPFHRAKIGTRIPCSWAAGISVSCKFVWVQIRDLLLILLLSFTDLTRPSGDELRVTVAASFHSRVRGLDGESSPGYYCSELLGASAGACT